MEGTALLHHYLMLKAEMARLEEEIEALKPAVFDYVSNQGEKLEFSGHQFLIQYRKTYDYSESVQALADEVKTMKKFEEANGVAQVKKMTGFVTVKQNRID